MNEYTLLPDLPRSMRRYRVTVTLPRLDGEEAPVPPVGQAVIELAAAAVLAEGLLTAWTCTSSVVSMVVELPSVADAPSRRELRWREHSKGATGQHL